MNRANDGDSIVTLQWCREVCLALPDATSDTPFGPGTEAMRVHGKIFALLSHREHVSEYPLVNLKVDPAELPLLVAKHQWLLPGYHMNKKHWVSVVLGPDLDRELTADLVEESYDTVVYALPAKLRSSLGRDAARRTETRGGADRADREAT